MPDPTPNGTKNFITSRSDWATWLPVVALLVSTSSGGAQSPEEVTSTLNEGAGLIQNLWAWLVGAAAIALKTWSNLRPSGKRVVLGVGTPVLIAGLGLLFAGAAFAPVAIASSAPLMAAASPSLVQVGLLAVCFGLFVVVARRGRGAV